ncbi:MAG: hypothetical protein JWO08_2425 [Verrucomicrobiaceae bacterium]|nr:hypothetical protein [Verrucomicrobiaceae bacterium]
MTTWLSNLHSWLKLVRLRLARAPLLIVERHGGIGDLLCALPAAAALKQRHPGARLLLLTARAFVPLAELSGIADCMVPSETRGLSRLRRWLHPILDVYPLLPDEQTPPKPRTQIHLIDEFARLLGVQDEALLYRSLTPSSRDIATVKSWLAQDGILGRSLVVVHTGPTWPVKQWPLEHWAALTSWFQKEQGMTVIQTGAEVHAGSHGVQAPRITGVLDWIGRLTVTETLALIAQARLFVGVDSGLLHLACAAGTPAVGLFGPTSPECILAPVPRAKGVKVEALDCIGCHHHPAGPQHWRTGCPRDIRCMRDLSVDTVYQQSLALLA